MTMIDFRTIYADLEKGYTGNQKRIEINSNLGVYYGINGDGNLRLAFMSSSIPPLIESTKLLKVTQGQESDGVYWTCFDLMQSTAKQVFYTFCSDIVSAIDGITDQKEALVILKNRFHTWKSLFKKDINKIPEEIIKGLLGELYFLKKHMIPLYGADNAVKSWSGPDGTSKDFSINTEWYEVKTISASAVSVKISSVEQLSTDVPGHLVIIKIESMSPQYSDGESSVGEIFSSLLAMMDADDIKERFLEKLLSYGFDISDDCFNKKYKIVSCTFYKVSENFPRVMEADIRFKEICKLSYELIINSLAKYKEG